MNDDPYVKLAEVLDKIPNSFLQIEDGTHLKLLRWVFTPEEAELAGNMRLRGETIEEMATRLGRDADNLGPMLETMAEKGQIRAWTSSSGRRYCLIPYVVGIYEEQLGRMDSEFARLADDLFIKSKGGELFGTKPAIFQVLPVNQAIDAELEVFPYEVAEQIVENSKSWGMRECICKKQQALLDNPCKYPTSVCLTFAAKTENAFDDDDLTQAITKEESLRILQEAHDAGLVHCTMNIQRGHNYICNCCTCCCGILRGVSVSGAPHAYVKSNFLASVDEDLCSGCETCVDRCQFDALSIPSDILEIDEDRCVGCGVCTSVCPEDALGLKPRPGKKHEPPERFMDWMTQKATARGVDPSDLW
jgi:electron transport complex protein RnfB